MLIEFIIHEGDYFKIMPTEPEDVKCPRCGGSIGHTFHELKGDLPWSNKCSWLCSNDECLQIDAELSKQKDRADKNRFDCLRKKEYKKNYPLR